MAEASIIKRKKTRPVYVGDVQVGGDAPVVVQSMTCTDTRDVKATVEQIRRLEDAGCELIRVAVPDREAAEVLTDIRKAMRVPLIADIHFNHILALEAIKNGADGIRINPGNISKDKIKEIISAAAERDIVIRIGINAGSLDKEILSKYGGPTSAALVESALDNIALFEGMGFTSIKLSLKSSDVATMVESCRLISEKTDYPLHLGVTEAGSIINSSVKSSIGIGILLYEGIGDTIRVSITGDPVSEVDVAYGILRALNVRRVGPDIISCPTCGRCEIDLFKLVDEVEEKLAGMKEYMKIALMGCVVNGPGEAAEADIGIAGGRGSGVLFKKGKVVRKIREEEFVEVLMDEIKRENLRQG
ncbi:MAG: flavodoxin-dependent (E)-4-hydroxy-3-methylbut-2-enyl-diphosphate synthase [Thermodesulfobacteriota bacterium]|nr:flavodoxin-dependent (E)-4-hydroxy-3-methylbut-2-enyl-diphosphate synthase [Thermodesulfobacteriota bacterium]